MAPRHSAALASSVVSPELFEITRAFIDARVDLCWFTQDAALRTEMGLPSKGGEFDYNMFIQLRDECTSRVLNDAFDIIRTLSD